MLKEAAKIKSYSANTYLYSVGGMSSNIYAVISGRVRLNITSSLGQQFSIVDMEDSYWFGESALMDGQAKVLEAQVKVDSQLLSIPAATVHKAAAISPVIYRNLFNAVIDRSRGVYTLLAGLAFYPLRARLAGRLLVLIEDHGVPSNGGIRLDIKLSQNDFASLSLGSRQRINKILREWHEHGVVTIEEDHYCIQDRAALEEEIVLQETD